MLPSAFPEVSHVTEPSLKRMLREHLDMRIARSPSEVSHSGAETTPHRHVAEPAGLLEVVSDEGGAIRDVAESRSFGRCGQCAAVRLSASAPSVP